MRLKVSIIALAALTSLTAPAYAQSTVPCILFGSEAADEGRGFWSIDPATGEGTLIGDPGQAITGLAFHPFTGVLYGATANIDVNSPTSSTIDPGHLVTIDPVTGVATDIGGFGFSTLADLAFDPATGTLYGWRSGNDGDLYTVNLMTGMATLVGESGLSDLSGGGIEFGPDGELYVAVEDAGGPLRTVNKLTGLPFGSIDLTGYDDEDASIAALTLDSAGFFYGVTRKNGDLIRINPSTGEIRTIGPAAGDDAAIDGLAFPSPCGTGAPAASSGVLLIIFAGLAAIGTWQIARRRNRQVALA
jgi:hypothetical protein